MSGRLSRPWLLAAALFLTAPFLTVPALLVRMPSVGAQDAPQKPPKVDARVSQQTVPLGGDTILTLTVDGADSAEAPGLDDLGKDFDVDYLGGQNTSQHSLMIAGGQRRRVFTQSYTMRYRVRPLRAGRLELPALTIVVGGQTLMTKPLAISVIGPRPSPIADLELRVSPRSPYVEQPITLELIARLKPIELDGSPMKRDPWVDQPPHLRVPWFRSVDGFASDDFIEWAEELLKGNAGGFAINGERSSSLLSSGLLRFHLPVKSVESDGDLRREYRLTRVLLPERPGRVQLPTSTLQATLVTQAATRDGSPVEVARDQAFVTHDDVFIDVRPIPTKGRPATYQHAVGQYRVEAEISPVRVKVGDPVELRLRVWGEGVVANVLPPHLDKQTSLTAGFAVSKPSAPSDLDGTTKVFTFTIRPLNDAVEEVPPLEFAFFDPEAGTFGVARTLALDLTVEETKTVGAADMIDSGGAVRRASTPGEEQIGGLLANVARADLLADESPQSGGGALFWLLLMGAPLAYGAGVLTTARRRRRLGDPLRLAAENAPDEVRRGVQAARDALLNGDEGEAASVLHRALAGFVAARARRPIGGMTAADVRTLFDERGVGDPRMADALVACESMQYGGGDSAEIRAAVELADGWIDGLLQEDLA